MQCPCQYFLPQDASLTAALSSCPNQDCRYPLYESKTRLKNMLQRKIQQHVNKYYQVSPQQRANKEFFFDVNVKLPHTFVGHNVNVLKC